MLWLVSLVHPMALLCIWLPVLLTAVFWKKARKFMEIVTCLWLASGALTIAYIMISDWIKRW